MSLTVNKAIDVSVEKVKPTDELLSLTFTNKDNQSHTILFYYPPGHISWGWNGLGNGMPWYFSIARDKLDILYAKIMSYVGKSDRILELPCGVGEFAMNFYIKNRNTSISYTGLDLSRKFIELNNMNYRASNMRFFEHDCASNPHADYDASHLLCLGMWSLLLPFIANYAKLKKPKYIFMESNTYRYGRGELTSNKIDDCYALLETFKYETRSLIIDDNPYIPDQGTQNRVLLIYKRK